MEEDVLEDVLRLAGMEKGESWRIFSEVRLLFGEVNQRRKKRLGKDA